MPSKGESRHRPVKPEPGRAPENFIAELEKAGITMQRSGGVLNTEENILTGSEQWRKLLSLLVDLPEPIGVDIYLNFTGGGLAYKPPPGKRPRRDYYQELMDYLPRLNPEDRTSDYDSVHGDARWIVEAAVRMVEDAPKTCPGARDVPEGRFMLCVGVEFKNLTLNITVLRRTSGTSEETPPVEVRGLGRAPKNFIAELEKAGIHMHKSEGVLEAEENIPTGSKVWRKLLSLLAELPKPIGVDICLNFTGDSLAYVPPRGKRPRKDYFQELMDHLPRLNPEDRESDHGMVHGDARSIVEAAVRMVEDAPKTCPAARAVPEGHYMLSVEVEFKNLILNITVFRKNSGALAIVPPIENRKPNHT